MRILFLAVLLSVSLAPALDAGAQEKPCDGTFHVVHQLGPLELNDVDFASPSEGWAVGFDYPDESRRRTFRHGPDERAVAVRFDRNSVERVDPPGGPGTELAGVYAISPSDVWAVGTQHPNKYRTTETVAYHWDGSVWSSVPTPSPGRYAWLRSVVATGPDDVWAVGSFERPDHGPVDVLVLHYDGNGWSRVASPSPGRLPSLWDVDAVSPTEAMAVGYLTRRSGHKRSFVIRWDGSSWSRERLGLEFPKSHSLVGIDAVSSDDIWAVGDGGNGALTLHFDGSGWSFVDFPASRGSDLLNEVAATETEAWAVGHRFVLRPYETVIPLAGHFSDGAWQKTSFEGDDYGDIEAVTLDGVGGAWAVGETFDPEGPDLGDVIERACS